MPEDASPEEHDILKQITHASQDRGTLLAMTESLHGGDPNVTLPLVPRSFIDLRSLDDTGEVYTTVLGFSQKAWPNLNLISDAEFRLPSRPLLANKVAKKLHCIHRNTIRYGCTSSVRTTADQFALALLDGRRQPVKILWHFQVSVAPEEPAVCCLITRLNPEGAPILPWSLQCVLSRVWTNGCTN